MQNGLCDSHGHIFGLGVKLNEADFSGIRSKEECIEVLKAKSPNRGAWLTGRGWNQELWEVKSFPAKEELDRSFPNIPVYLTRVDGHAAWVNSKALEICGIDKESTNPQGGEILKGEDGEPRGILIDNAMNLCLDKIPQYSEVQIEKYILDGCNECKRAGLSAVHDMDVKPEILRVFEKLTKEDRLPIMIHSFVSGQNDEFIEEGIKPFRIGNLNVCGVKYYMDGALGSRGALLLEPYSDAPGVRGLQLITDERLIESAAKALDLGFIIAAHAIGDAANRIALNAYGKLRKMGYNSKNQILRIEHAQMVHPEDMRKFKDYNIIPSIQPIHYESDREMALSRIGEERLKYSYPWKSFFKLGLKPCAGSDFPIESHNPQRGISAFTSPSPVNANVNHEHEKISLEEAVAAYTINANLAAGF